MDLQARKYHQAAIGYLVYGLIYLAGAIYLGRIGKGPDGTVLWYLIGAAMIRHGFDNGRAQRREHELFVLFGGDGFHILTLV